MVLEVRVSIVPGFVVEGQNWTNPIVEGPKVDFFLKKILHRSNNDL